MPVSPLYASHMGWYQRFRDAMHAKPPPLPPLPPGPNRVREWWFGHVCPCPPLTLAQEAREAGMSLSDYARWYWVGDYDLTPEDKAAFERDADGVVTTMVAVMAAAEEHDAEWPDLQIDTRP